MNNIKLDAFSKQLSRIPSSLLSILDRIAQLRSPALDLTERIRKDQALLNDQNSAMLRKIRRDTNKLASYKIESLNDSQTGKFIEHAIFERVGEINKLNEALIEATNEYPERMKAGIMKLASNGWFMDSNMDIVLILGSDESTHPEKEIILFYKNRLKQIQKFLTKEYPNRAHIIRAIFKSHRTGLFELSVPVIFTQVDGICNEVTKRYLFIRSNGKPGTAEYFESLELDAITESMLTPFSQKSSILFNEKERNRNENYDSLNRHLVLHGDSLDYATEINSLKAISMLSYVCNALKGVKKELNKLDNR